MDGRIENKQKNDTKNEIKRSRVPFLKEKQFKTYETKSNKKFNDKTRSFLEAKSKEGVHILGGNGFNSISKVDLNNSTHIDAIGRLYYKDSFLANPWGSSQ